MRARRHSTDTPSERLEELLALPEDAASADKLVTALDDVSLDVARQALRRLVRVAGPNEITRMRERMLAVDVGLVGDLASTLGELGDDHASKIALAALRSDSWTDRHKAALALRELQVPGAAHALVAALTDPASPVRRVALEALQRLPAEPGTIEACGNLLHDPSPSVRAAAVSTIANLGAPPTRALRVAARDPHPSVRRALAEAAAVLDADLVQALVTDREPNVRVAALEAFEREPRPELIGPIQRSLRDPSWHVRRAAVDALGHSRCPDVGRALIEALDDAHPLVRSRARIALERLLGDDLDRLMRSALDEAEAPLRRALVELLGVRGSTPFVLERIADPDPNVRVAVVHALVHASAPEVTAGLEALASGDPEPAVRHAARTAVEQSSASQRD